ncbi:MAG: MBL fold metallo-hydrolase [Candidatus Diapherotrites archaeon]
MFEKITENLYRLIVQGNSSNVFLIKADQNILIDTGLEADSKKLEQALENENLIPKDISLILHTHGHADHIGGDILFPRAEKWMSKFDGELVNEKDDSFVLASWFNQYHYPEINNFYKKNQVFEFGNFSLKVIETPGHTRGSVSFYDEKNKILFSGDTLFKGTIGRYDLNSSSKEELTESIKKISQLDYKILLPSHGEILRENQKENIEAAFKLLE